MTIAARFAIILGLIAAFGLGYLARAAAEPGPEARIKPDDVRPPIIVPVPGAVRRMPSPTPRPRHVSRAETRIPLPGGPTPEQWAKLRACEATGNYRAVSPSGTYRGAYQFDARTWAAVGGHGDPAAAPPAEQDMRARLLYADRGAQPWPRCGRYL